MYVFRKFIVLICAVALAGGLFVIPAAAEGQVWEYAIEPQYVVPSGIAVDYGIFVDGIAIVQTQDGEYIYIDTKGNRAYPPKSWNASSIYSGGENELKRVYENGAYGFSDKDGNIVIPCQFEYADPRFRKGLGRVTVNDKMGVIDTSGNFVIEPIWYSVNFDDRYYDTKVEYFTVATQDGKCGVVDKTGNVIISAVWDYISPWFSEGLACVIQGNKHGYVDFNNNIVIEPQFEFAEGFDSKTGLAQVHVNGLLGWIRLKKSFTANVTVISNPTSSTILVNGKNVAFDAYLIDGNNYFKLRDLAYAITGTERVETRDLPQNSASFGVSATEKDFGVYYDAENNEVVICKGYRYKVIGGEMQSKGNTAKNAVISDQKVRFYHGSSTNSRYVNMTAYMIEGNNYMKLRDVAKLIDFGVSWDGERNTIVIDTSNGYIEE